MIIACIGIVTILVAVVYVVIDGYYGTHPVAKDREIYAASVPMFIPQTFLNFVGMLCYIHIIYNNSYVALQYLFCLG